METFSCRLPSHIVRKIEELCVEMKFKTPGTAARHIITQFFNSKGHEDSILDALKRLEKKVNRAAKPRVNEEPALPDHLEAIISDINQTKREIETIKKLLVILGAADVRTSATIQDHFPQYFNR